MIKRTIKRIGLSASIPVSIIALFMIAASPAQATISCAGYLPSSYFDSLGDNKEFSGKLVELADGSQQLEDLNGKVIVDGLTDGYILMNKYLWAQQIGENGKKYGIVTATGEVNVPFAYDNIATELDIATSFIVSVNKNDVNDADINADDFDDSNNLSKQGIIDRNGYWIYPKPKKLQKNKVAQQHHQRRVDNGYGDYNPAKETQQLIKAADTPLNLTSATIRHAHYDSDQDRDYFLITSLSGDKYTTGTGESAAQSVMNKTGLLDDQGNWVISQQYDALQPLNACTGQPLYLQATLITAEQQQTALLDQHANIIIPFASNQNIELFHNNDKSPLFLRNTLIDGSTATGMTEDIKDDIVSAKIIDTTGKVRLSSNTPIVKLLYHQLYAYQQAGKFGFIDGQGTIVLKPQFDSYRDDADKVWVEKQGKMVRLETLIKLD